MMTEVERLALGDIGSSNQPKVATDLESEKVEEDRRSSVDKHTKAFHSAMEAQLSAADFAVQRKFHISASETIVQSYPSVTFMYPKGLQLDGTLHILMNMLCYEGVEEYYYEFERGTLVTSPSQPKASCLFTIPYTDITNVRLDDLGWISSDLNLNITIRSKKTFRFRNAESCHQQLLERMKHVNLELENNVKGWQKKRRKQASVDTNIPRDAEDDGDITSASCTEHTDSEEQSAIPSYLTEIHDDQVGFGGSTSAELDQYTLKMWEGILPWVQL